MDRLLENLRKRIGNGLASSSINRVILWNEICQSSKEFLAPKFFVLVGYNVFLLLRSIEGIEKKDENCYCALDIQKFGCREISVFMMDLSRNCD